MPKREDRRQVRRGDFLVDPDAIREAEASFEERSARSRAVDRSLRGPIVGDVDFWKRNQRAVDFPGVDTPTDTPRQSLADFPGPRDRDRMVRGKPMDVEPVGGDAGVSLSEGLVEDLEMSTEQIDRGLDLLDGDRT